MNIALIGYGKMGQLIEQIAIEKGHSITVIVNSSNPIENHNLKNVDVAIDFSTPKSAFHNIKFILSNRIPVVSGTTGWLNNINKARELAAAKEIGFLYSSNFSIGANIFFELKKSK